MKDMNENSLAKPEADTCRNCGKKIARTTQRGWVHSHGDEWCRTTTAHPKTGR